jgi:very-short-patch-repair endonuclease
VGEPFVSVCAPKPASAVEASLRAALLERLEFDATQNAVRLGRPFFDHLEAWPDLVLGDLRVAVEYDSTGRHGLEHTGKREAADARKDRLLRQAGWEVVRIRSGHLPAIGPHDLAASAINGRVLDRLLDELRSIRGDLLVNAYLRG